MVLSIDNDGKRKRIPQYTMAAQSVSPEYSAINSGNISPCFREANPNTIIAEVIAKYVCFSRSNVLVWCKFIKLSWITWQDGSNSDKNRFYLHTKLFVLLKCYKVVRALSR